MKITSTIGWQMHRNRGNQKSWSLERLKYWALNLLNPIQMQSSASSIVLYTRAISDLFNGNRTFPLERSIFQPCQGQVTQTEPVVGSVSMSPRWSGPPTYKCSIETTCAKLLRSRLLRTYWKLIGEPSQQWSLV